MDPIPEILDELRHGRMIVLVDDEQRENEGDLVCAAEAVTPQTINFMLREARGMLCVSLAGELCDRLELPLMRGGGTSLHGTAYTVSVDAQPRLGITTGVSAADRAKTIRLLADPQTRPGDLVRPGHVQPLRARAGGALVRAGQTEGSVDLCRLAGLTPAAVIIEVMNEDGTMARQPELRRLCERHGLKMCSVADVVEYRLQREKLVRRVEQAPFENGAGRWTLMAYESRVDPLPHVALVCGGLGERDATGQPVEVDEPVLVRMHSQNLLGDVLGDVTQPSGATLQRAMGMIQRAGRGAVVYLRHERTGTGLLQRLHTSRTGEDGDAVEAGGQAAAHRQGSRLGEGQPTPGMRPPAHTGAYGIGCQVLRDLGVRKLRLITNHPFMPTALSGFGLEIVEFVPVAGEPG